MHRLKIKPEHFRQLKELLEPHDTPQRREAYRAGDFPRADRVKDLNVRYRWDLLYSVPYVLRCTLFEQMYEYLEDSHIDSAMRHAVPEL